MAAAERHLWVFTSLTSGKERKEERDMTQKIRILTMVFLALVVELAMAGIGGAAAAHAAATPTELAWSPTTSLGTYDYGTLAAGATKSVTFTLTNAGGKATGPLRITLSRSAAFTISSNRCSGRSLGPKKSCTVAVVYAPKSSGQSESAMLTASGKAASASLTLTGQAGVGGTPTLTLSPGRFLGPGNDAANDYDYGFGIVGAGSSKTTTFTVTNSSTSSSQSLFITCEDRLPSDPQCPQDEPFMFLNDKCTDMILGANQSCTFDLEFTAPANCVPNYITNLEVIGTDVTYINLFVAAECAS
jgi:hypothetical protein